MAVCKFNLIVRSLCTSRANNQLIKAPVKVFGVSGRYATAIYSAGVKAKEIDVIEKELVGFQKALTEDKKFRQFMKDPTIKKSVKSNALQLAATKFNISKTTANTLNLLAENGRLKNFEQILNSFKIIMAAHRGEIPCEIISAQPLDAESLKAIETALGGLAKGKKVMIHTKVDPKILGGLILVIGDKYADLSVASKINTYTNILKSVV